VVKKTGGKDIGAWAFLIGILLVLVMALFNLSGGLGDWIFLILVLAGIIVGFLNVDKGESQKFLLAMVSLVIVSFMGGNVFSSLRGFQLIGDFIKRVLDYVLVLFVPATIVVAIRAGYSIAKD